MANLEEYIFENILMEEMKLNRLSNQLGKIILTIYNALTKIDDEDTDKYEKLLSILKEMRVEMLTLEKKFYSKSITGSDLDRHISSYVKALKKIKKGFSSLDDKKIQRALLKMEKLISKLENLKIVL